MSKKDLATFLTLFLISLILNIYRLGDISSGFHGDEAELSLFALKVANGEITSLIGVGQHNHPITTFLPQALSFVTLGGSIFAARFPSAIISALSIIVFYLFVKYLFNFRIALFSSLLLITSHLWIAMSRLAINNIQIVFFELLTFFFLFLGLNKEKQIYFFLTGIGCGMTFYLYAGYRIIPFIIAITFLYAFIRDRNKFVYLPRFILLIVGFLIISLPQIFFFYNNPNSFLDRTDDIYIFSNSPTVTEWKQSVMPNKSILKILTNQTLKTFMISEGARDTSGQYGYPQKVLLIPILILVAMGILLSILNIFDIRYLFLITWFMSVLISGNVLAVDPFFLPRATGALPALFALVVLPVESIFKLFESKSKTLRVSLFILALFLILWSALINLRIYFYESEHKQYGDPNKYSATRIAEYLKTVDPTYDVVFLTSPFIYADFAPIRFIAPYNENEYTNIDDPNSFVATPRSKTVYILYPKYRYKLEEIKAVNPSGKLISSYNNFDAIQFFIYKID